LSYFTFCFSEGFNAGISCFSDTFEQYFLRKRSFPALQENLLRMKAPPGAFRATIGSVNAGGSSSRGGLRPPSTFRNAPCQSMVFGATRYIYRVYTGVIQGCTRGVYRGVQGCVQGIRIPDTDTGYRIRIPGYRLQNNGYGIRDTGYRIQDTVIRIRDTDTGIRILDTETGYGIPEYGNRIPNTG